MSKFALGSSAGGRTVKAEILAFVLPVVILGLLVLAGVIFKFTGSAFEEQLESSSLKTTSEVADGVSDWFDARMLETQMTANSLAARGLPGSQAELIANNELRLKLMEKIYPGVYDSVSWGPFDGSGLLHGWTKSGYKEIERTIEAVRFLYPGKRVVGIFQPHLYSRTRDLADEFARVLQTLDEVIMLPIYPAREKPILGVTSSMVLRKMDTMSKYLCTPDQALELVPALCPDIVLTLGAGDIDRLVPRLETTLRDQLLTD